MAALAAVKTIPVVGGSQVLIKPGILEEVPERLEEIGLRPSSYVIVSDDTVFGLYGQRLVDAFARRGVTADPGSKPRLLSFFFAHGEKSKTRETKAAVEDYMLEHKCQRDSCIIALGGGVVGDLAGFVAGTYMRGIPVVQVPTSTMAMIDSSVGGKTAINVPAGKNLIGVFNQPRVIFADPAVLRTLSRREAAEGLAEAIKMGVIRDAELFDLMLENAESILDFDPILLQEVLHRAVGHKAAVVAMDEKESGVRATLNYGHTIGHSVEGALSPVLLHGECVAIGAVAEAELAVRMGHLRPGAAARIRDCFERYGLPVEFPQGLTVQQMMDFILVDKKNEGGNIRCTIITDVGKSIDNPQPVPGKLMEAVVGDCIAAAAESKQKRLKTAAAGQSDALFQPPTRQGRVKVNHTLLVGMRAAGKTYCGNAAAKALSRPFLDLDELLEKEVLKMSINAFVAAHGWPAFRSAESQLLTDVMLHGKYLPAHADGVVIATGGGIVETSEALAVLKGFSPVIFVDRHISDIVITLEGSGSYRPGLGADPREIYTKRRSLYLECSDYIFTLQQGEDNWPSVTSRFLRLVEFATGDQWAVSGRGCEVIVPITAADPEAAVAEVADAAVEGAGMVELRLDLLRGGAAAAEAALPALLGAAKARALLVVATFRAKWEDPNAGCECPEAERTRVLRQAAAAGAAYIDVERKAMAAFEAAGGLPAGSSTRIIVSSHDFAKLWELPELRALAAEMRALAGPTGVVKIAQMPSHAAEAARMLQLLVESEGQPTVALAMGAAGMFTRLLAPRCGALFTFGCFSGPGRASAPGQPTATDMIRIYRLKGHTRSTKVFGIIGDPVGHSRSPALFNRAFVHSGLDAVYVPLLVSDCSLADFLAAMPSGLLSGASVTIPHKEAALRAASDKDSVANSIGAANTLVLQPSGTYMAYNTDWAAAVDACAASLGGEGSLKGTTACVVGAGGAGRAIAYGFRARGCAKVLVANRSADRAQALAKDLGAGCEAVSMEEVASGRLKADVLANSTSVGMHPAEEASPVPRSALGNFRVVFDAVYTPRRTRLLRESEEAGCALAEGLDMFIGQAMAQYVFFTGSTVQPDLEHLMRSHVIASLEKH